MEQNVGKIYKYQPLSNSFQLNGPWPNEGKKCNEVRIAPISNRVISTDLSSETLFTFIFFPLVLFHNTLL